MNVKILIVPLLIVIMIMLGVFWMYPLYSNPVDGSGLKEKYAELQDKEKRLANLNEKEQNVNRLTDDLMLVKPKYETLMKFLPDGAKEESLFDNLNYLVKNEGGKVLKINISRIKDKDIAEISQASASQAGSEVSGGMSALAGDSPVMIRKSLELWEVSLSFAANYDQTKNVLAKLHTFERSNKISLISIGVPETVGDEAGTEPKAEASDVLITDIIFEFDSFKKISKVEDADLTVFEKNRFDTSVIDEIAYRKNVPALELNPGVQGKANLFLP